LDKRDFWTDPDPEEIGSTAGDFLRQDWLINVSIFLAAMFGRLPALGAWWNRDDWGLLGQAAGIIEKDGSMPARWLSQHLYWDLTWPLFGTNSDPHAWIRMILHGLSAVLVSRIALRAGLPPVSRLAAGLIFAATPLAFTILYWAAGIQELLAGFFALLAVERWLGATRNNQWQAFAAAVLSILSKESGLGLPLLFAALIFVKTGPIKRDRKLAWGLIIFLISVAFIEGKLIVEHFATGPGDSYALGNPLVALGNLGVFGWWLMSPGPVLASKITWPISAGGGMLFILWSIYAVLQWKRKNLLPALSLLGAFLSVAPALALDHHLYPYYGYLAAAAGALTLGSALPGKLVLRQTLLIALCSVAIIWGFFGMQGRLKFRNEFGTPADPLVRSTSFSWQTCRFLPNLLLPKEAEETHRINFLQMPLVKAKATDQSKLGDYWVHHSELYESLHGTLGPKLILGEDVQIEYTNALFSTPADALVLCEASTGFKHWGRTPNALLYPVLTDIGTGHFDRARHHLVLVGNMSDDAVAFIWDPDQMIIPMAQVLANKEYFVDWTATILGPDHSANEVGGVQEMFFNLLSICTGEDFETISAGSQIIRKAQNGLPSGVESRSE